MKHQYYSTARRTCAAVKVFFLILLLAIATASAREDDQGLPLSQKDPNLRGTSSTTSSSQISSATTTATSTTITAPLVGEDAIGVVAEDSPAVRLEQDGSGFWHPYQWELCGNEARFGIRDLTGNRAIPFQIRSGAPENALYLDNRGGLGIGLTNSPYDNPEARLDVRGNALVAGTITSQTTTQLQADLQRALERIEVLEAALLAQSSSSPQRSDCGLK